MIDYGSDASLRDDVRRDRDRSSSWDYGLYVLVCMYSKQYDSQSSNALITYIINPQRQSASSAIFSVWHTSTTY